MKLTKGARILHKRNEISGIIPTVPTSNDHTTGWLETDIYKGELYMNLQDNRIWTRMNSGITEISVLDPATGKIKLSNLPPSILGSVRYQGTWNASTGNPPITIPLGHESEYKGFYYIVSVSGTTNLNGINVWHVQDWAIFDGVYWGKVDNYQSSTATNVSYSNTEYPSITNVKQALDYLLYVSPKINSFYTTVSDSIIVGNTTYFESGRTLLENNLSISWNVNKIMTYIGIDDYDYYHSGNLAPALSGTISNPSIPNFEGINSDYYFTIEAIDSTNIVTGISWLKTCNKVYWGVNASSSLNNSQILSLNSALSITKVRTITVNPVNHYWYYCVPQSLGVPIFTISGLEVSPIITSQNVTNTYGKIIPYYICRSEYPLTGSVTIIIN